jgi:PAS domain S-box-containing protein
MQTDKTAEANGAPARAQRVRFLAATFRSILLVVSLLFVFAVVRTIILWVVCNNGMKTAATMEYQGLPALKELAALQENLALYRLDSYEYLFAQEAEKARDAKAADGTALQMRAELKNIQTLFPEGEGRQLAANLEKAVDDLDAQFQKVRGLVDSDFPAAMKSMDQDIPPRTERVETAANALKNFGYQFSTAQANATFASFGSIKRTAVLFGILNSLVAFCAFMFVLLAARRSRAQVSETLARLDERTQELQQSNGALETEVDKYQRSEKLLRESEERFSSAFELAPIGMALVAPDGRWLKVNRAICAIVGYSEAELLARTFQEITHPDDLTADLECVRRLLAGEIRFYEMEKRYIHARGHFVTVLLDVSLVCDAQGRPLYFISQIQDITERKRAEAELSWKTAFLEAQVNSSIDGIIVVDPQGRKILQNQRITDLVKIPRHIVDDPDDGKQVQWFKDMNKNPELFVAKVVYLYAHPDETSRDEIELTDGTVLDRYSSPVLGQDGKNYGRIWTFRDITERKRDEESLRLLGTAVEQSKESILITDAELNLPGPKIIFVNSAFTQMTGYAAAEVLGKTPRMFQGPHTDKAVLKRLRQNLEDGDVFAGEAVNYRKDGVEFILEWQIAPIRNAVGKITHFIGIERDITGRKKLEEQLVQSQKMETVGKLAGGIAHEFNSILTAIIGQSELLLGDLPAGSPLAGNAAEIIKAANRAATLTRQLLAYSRKQFLQPEILDINRLVSGMAAMIHNHMGGGVDAQFVPAADLRAVKADAGQIEQVIMNIVINARDAMPNGGRLTLETANVSFSPESVGRYAELQPGDYVMLAITDTGAGMSDAVKARLFEPFFSTKGVGEGTGLGLSTCYGIVKQSGGHISVYSELGRGTTFKIYLPQAEPPAKTAPDIHAPPALPRGTETILLVEDNPALRDMAAGLLRRLGYTVFAASNGIEALTVKQQPGTGHIDLLFTDVVMPHMSGNELADRVRSLYPRTKILFTSAYTENAIVHQGILNTGVVLLQKPFTPSALAQKVRQVLDRKESSEK